MHQNDGDIVTDGDVLRVRKYLRDWHDEAKEWQLDLDLLGDGTDPELDIAQWAEVAGIPRNTMADYIRHAGLGREVKIPNNHGRKRVVRWSEMVDLLEDVRAHRAQGGG